MSNSTSTRPGSPARTSTSRPIESYAVIGDRHTAALVGSDGAIDWLCLPRFDSSACLAALLGDDDNGRWQLAPAGGEPPRVTRRYLDDSSVLETTFTTDSGTLTLTDAMPFGDHRADVVRTLRCTAGSVRIHHLLKLRFDYGRILPWVRRRELPGGEEILSAVAGPDQLVLRGPRLPKATDHVHEDDFTLHDGEEMTFTLTWLHSHRDPAELVDDGDPRERVAETIAEEREWLSAAPRGVPHPEIVQRSLLTLRLLTHAETGGIVAAPTTSLPEDPGGSRNWDYRYVWLRDAALTVSALVRSGYASEADTWREWLLRSVAGDPQDLQIMYAVDGSRHMPELELPGLAGYAGSRPVRVGNDAAGQLQHDVLGEVMDALHDQRVHHAQAHHPDDTGVDGKDDAESWSLQRILVDELATHWQEPDHGLWEIRGEPQAFVHSRVMEWVAFDRAVQAVEQFGLEGPVERWRSIRDQIREEILTQGVDPERGCFVQHYGTTEIDAALLQLPMMGFVAGDDPRMLATIAAVEKELIREGLVLRYRTSSGVDGLPGDEHPFLACSFWLVEAYALAGRRADAEALFDRLVGLANDVGLLSEEYDPVHERMIGNFPQAFSHLALVRAALALAKTS